MRLLIVIPSLKQGGAERVASMLSRQWAAAHETRILIFNGESIAYDYGGALVDVDLKAASGFGKLLNGVRRIGAIRREMRSFRPHLVVSFTESANMPTAVACILAGCRRRTFISLRSNPRMFTWPVRWIGGMAYRLTAGIVACSEGAAEAAAQVYRMSRDRIRVIVNPVEVDEGESEGDAREPSPPVTDKPYFVAVGRLGWEKGYDVLFQAWKQSGLAATHRLLVLGDGPLNDELRALAESLGLSESVQFLGPVRNPFPIVRGAKAFVLASRFEGWPNALVEAMALGVPAISTDCDFGPAEIIRNESEGILVPVDDVEALRSAMLDLSKDERRRQQLAATGQARTAHLTPERIAREWLALANCNGRSIIE